MLVCELAAEWLRFKEAEIGASTLYTYERLLTKRLLPRIGGLRLDSVTAEELQSMLMQALTECSENEALKMRALLRGMFGYAHALELVRTNPAGRIRLPKGTGSRRDGIHKVPKPADAVAMADALAARYELMPLLAAFAGLRWQEVAALRAEDFDLGKRELTIRRAVGRLEGVKNTKSPAGERRTVWAREVHERISRRVSLAQPSDRLFTSPRGALLRYPNWRNRFWLPACEIAGLDWTFHQYRHTFAVESLRRGRSIQSVSALMGHSNPRVTWEIYAGLFDDHIEEAKRKW